MINRHRQSASPLLMSCDTTFCSAFYHFKGSVRLCYHFVAEIPTSALERQKHAYVATLNTFALITYFTLNECMCISGQTHTHTHTIWDFSAETHSLHQYVLVSNWGEEGQTYYHSLTVKQAFKETISRLTLGPAPLFHCGTDGVCL